MFTAKALEWLRKSERVATVCILVFAHGSGEKQTRTVGTFQGGKEMLDIDVHTKGGN